MKQNPLYEYDPRTTVVLFNKKMYKMEGFTDKYGDPYEMVKNRTWTLDKLGRIAKEAVKDINGDGILNDQDQWGFGTEMYNLYLHCLAGGCRIASNDSSGKPVLSIKDENAYRILCDASEIYSSGKVLVADDDSAIRAFSAGKELFLMCGLLHVPYFRNMDDDFGILPVPLYTENQNRYYSSVNPENISCLMIPNHGSSVSKNLGYVIQELAKLSKQKVTPEYYNKQLKGRDTRDDASKEMIDLIFDSKVYDIGAAFSKSWGNIIDLYTQTGENIVSRFEAVADMIEARMEDDIELIKDIQSETW